METKNAKDPRWVAPVALPEVKPSDYKENIEVVDNAAKERLDSGPPDYTVPGYPSGKESAPQKKSKP